MQCARAAQVTPEQTCPHNSAENSTQKPLRKAQEQL